MPWRFPQLAFLLAIEKWEKFFYRLTATAAHSANREELH
jgi:hypothetical protein